MTENPLVQSLMLKDGHEEKTKKIGLYPGSFDPPTFGHLNVIERASKIFDEVIVLLSVNPRKSAFIPLDARLDLLQSITNHLPNVTVDCLEFGLTVDYAKSANVCSFVRGMRPAGDFEPEYTLAMCNFDLAPNIDTIWLATTPMYSHISSTLVKEVYKLGHNNEWTKWVPTPVIQYLQSMEGDK